MVSQPSLAIALCKLGIHDTHVRTTGSYECIRCGETWKTRMEFVEEEYEMDLSEFTESFEDRYK